MTNLINKRFEKLLVIADAGTDKRYRRLVKCKCDCGNIVTIRADGLGINNKTCGCYRHGLKKTIEFSIWNNIKQRCYNKNNKNYNRYGARGIRLYKDWYNDFVAFYNWIQENLGPRPSSNHSLDRKNNDGHYVPSNLRWATKKEQASNRKSYIILYEFIILGNDYY